MSENKKKLEKLVQLLENDQDILNLCSEKAQIDARTLIEAVKIIESHINKHCSLYKDYNKKIKELKKANDAINDWCEVMESIKECLNHIGCECVHHAGDATPPMFYPEWIACTVRHHSMPKKD